MPHPPQKNHPRFFCPGLPHPRLGESRCALDPDQTRHARKVLRLEPGQTIGLFNGQGLAGTATLMAYDDGLAWCQVVQIDEHPEPNPKLIVATAVPKGPRADEMVAQLSQLGADLFVPLRTERSVVDPRSTKLDRLRKLALESAKQCGRSWVMAIAEPADLGAVLREPCDLGLVLEPRTEPIPDLAGKLRGARTVTLIIGPEGGLTAPEVQDAQNRGFALWSIGPHILRIESAATAATAIVRYLTG